MNVKSQHKFLKKKNVIILCIAGILCCFIIGIVMFFNSYNMSEKQNKNISESTTPFETNPDWYLPNYDSPTMEEIFSTEPFDDLMPRLGLENFTMTNSYRYLQDDFSNPQGNINIRTDWKLNNNELSISIVEYNSGANYQAYYPLDITKDMLNSFTKKATISIICGEYCITYSYNGIEFSADKLFEIITSSNWFKELKK